MRRARLAVLKRAKFGRIFWAVLAVAIVGAAGYSQARSSVRASEPTGSVKTVIVKMRGVEAVDSLTESGKQRQRLDIKSANLALNRVGGGYIEKVRDYNNLPYAVYAVDAAGESALRADSLVESVAEDEILKPFATTPIPTIGGSAVNGFSDGSALFTGNGYAVAVIDSGVDKSHPALAGKVIAEACFGMNLTFADATLSSLCPGGVVSSTEVGSGQDCTIPNCGHGTAVAGAAAMLPWSIDINGDTINDNLSGTAQDAKIVAVKAMTNLTETGGGTDDYCGDGLATLSSCGIFMESVYLAGLDYVATLSTSQPIAAANLSVGSTSVYASTPAECGGAAFDTVASTLRAHNIAPIVAAGNYGDNPSYYNKISNPACADGAIAVAATNVTGTALASYSNNGPLTDLLAPGGDYVPGFDDSLLWLPKSGTSGMEGTAGTSFAAPMVAGAYAVLREAHPNATVDQLTALLQTTGTDVTDARSGYTVGAKKLIQLDAALAAASDPIIATFTGPTGTINEGTNITLNIAASNVESCSLNNGVGAVTVTGVSTPHAVPAKASYTLTCQGTYGDVVSSVLNFTLNAAPSLPSNVVGGGDQNARTYLVQWDASSDADGVESYLVYVNGALVATLNASARSYLLSNIQFGQAYNVEVRALDTLGALSGPIGLAFTMTSGGVVAPSVPNTGAGPLKSVQPWQIVAVASGAAFVIVMLARRPSQVREKSKR